jgi:hypothetical protein
MMRLRVSWIQRAIGRRGAFQFTHFLRRVNQIRDLLVVIYEASG